METCSLFSDEEILAYITRHSPRIVSIVCPLGLPVAGTEIHPQAGIVRVAEQDLSSIGIPAYPALIDSMQNLTLRGISAPRPKPAKRPVPMCEALAITLSEFRQQTPYDKDEDFVFASPTLNGKQPLWGQTMNALFVKPAAVELGLVADEDRFGWHRFRHSLSTWANDTTKDITVSQTMLRHAKPDITAAIYTHGNFGKALDAQKIYMEQLLRMQPTSESTQ